MVDVGIRRHDKNISIFTLPIHFGKKIIGFYGAESDSGKDMPRYLKLIDSVL